MARSLRYDTAWIIAGWTVYAVSQWSVLIVLGHLKGPQPIGEFTLALAITSPVILFTNLGLRQVYVSETSELTCFTDYLTVRIFAGGTALCVIFGIALLADLSAHSRVAVVLLGLARAIESISDIYYAVPHRQQRLAPVAKSMMLRSVLGFGALSVLTVWTEKLAIGTSALVVIWTLTLLLLDRHFGPRHSDGRKAPTSLSALLRHHRPARLQLLKDGLPLGANSVLASLNVNIPRYFIGSYLGVTTLGFFAPMAHFVLLGQMFVDAACQAAIPRLARGFAQGNVADCRHVLIRLFLFGGLLGTMFSAITILLGDTMLTFFYGYNFGEASTLFPWIMMVGLVIFISSPLFHTLTSLRRFRIQPAILAGSLLINLFCNAVFVPRYGLAGAVLAWLAAILFRAVLALVAVLFLVKSGTPSARSEL